MTFLLHQAVIHSFEKEQYSKEIDTKKVVKQPLFDTKLPSVIMLVQKIHTILGKQKNSVQWGQFANDGIARKFPQSVYNYTNNKDAKNFEELSHTTIDELVDQAKNEAFATGSHTLIANYSSENKEFILIANVKEKDGLRFGKNYVPIETSNIDISQILQAARINVVRYISSLTTSIDGKNHLNEDDKTYLCFISKGKDTEASRYFINALGCVKGIASSRATKNSIDCIFNYFNNNQKISKYAKPAKENVIKYLRGKLESKDPDIEKKASISGLIHAATKAIPAEHPELLQELEDLGPHLNSEENQVPEEFIISQPEINKRVKIKGATSAWDLEFETSALGTNANSSVFYDEVQNAITLSNIPNDLKKKIELHLNKGA